jgi:protein SCO1/2
MRRSRRLQAAAAVLALAGVTVAPSAWADHGWHDIDMAGVSPNLHFAMTRASDGKLIDASDLRGDVVLLYFGYTSCPDVCPLTMGRIAQVLGKLGKQADRVRVLFITVDPTRDTLPILAQYAAAFGPQVVGLRGTPDALASLTRRYRIAYSVDLATKTKPEEVTHSSAIYVFDGTGHARLLIPSLASTTPDVEGVTADLHRLLSNDGQESLSARLMGAL